MISSSGRRYRVVTILCKCRLYANKYGGIQKQLKITRIWGKEGNSSLNVRAERSGKFWGNTWKGFQNLSTS
jgi:hypothetical protein